jgi:hypothetical protein
MEYIFFYENNKIIKPGPEITEPDPAGLLYGKCRYWLFIPDAAGPVHFG